MERPAGFPACPDDPVNLVSRLMPTAENPYRDELHQDLDIEVPESPAALIEEREKRRFEWTLIAVGLLGLLFILAIVASVFAIAAPGDDTQAAPPVKAPVVSPAAAAPDKAPTLADAKGVAFEKFARVDPRLPKIPSGPVKKFTIDVLEHVTQVAPALAP